MACPAEIDSLVLLPSLGQGGEAEPRVRHYQFHRDSELSVYRHRVFVATLYRLDERQTSGRSGPGSGARLDSHNADATAIFPDRNSILGARVSITASRDPFRCTENSFRHSEVYFGASKIHCGVSKSVVPYPKSIPALRISFRLTPDPFRAAQSPFQLSEIHSGVQSSHSATSSCHSATLRTNVERLPAPAAGKPDALCSSDSKCRAGSHSLRS